MSFRIEFAKYFATTEHVVKNHQMYNNLPYTHHLEMVANVLVEFGILDEDYIIAGWLHDVLEDCKSVKRKHLTNLFGDRVAELVYAVTDEPGRNRKEKHDKTYPKTSSIEDGVIIKLADRIANVRGKGDKFDMYKKEYEDFQMYLREDFKLNRAGSKYNKSHKKIVENMWEQLDNIFK